MGVLGFWVRRLVLPATASSLGSLGLAGQHQLRRCSLPSPLSCVTAMEHVGCGMPQVGLYGPCRLHYWWTTVMLPWCAAADLTRRSDALWLSQQQGLHMKVREQFLGWGYVLTGCSSKWMAAVLCTSPAQPVLNVAVHVANVVLPAEAGAGI
jgi:hypothetical protein